MVEATNSSAISGTPRMNSMNMTHRTLTAGMVEVRPSANATADRQEKKLCR